MRTVWMLYIPVRGMCSVMVGWFPDITFFINISFAFTFRMIFVMPTALSWLKFSTGTGRCRPSWKRRRKIRQPHRVNKLNRIRRVLIIINTTLESYRILRNEAPTTGIIVAVTVVMQPRLLVKLLPLEPKRLLQH